MRRAATRGGDSNAGTCYPVLQSPPFSFILATECASGTVAMVAPSRKARPRYPADPLRAITMFHQGRDPAHIALRRLVRRLQKAGIVHAIMGGMAVYVHGHRRMTD